MKLAIPDNWKWEMFKTKNEHNSIDAPTPHLNIIAM
jgi:hypothetical protein